jgi:hypothetical protein
MTTESLVKHGRTVRKFIEVHCRQRHGRRDELCTECGELLDYVLRAEPPAADASGHAVQRPILDAEGPFDSLLRHSIRPESTVWRTHK